MTLTEQAIPMPMFWLNETMKLDSKTTEEMYEKSIKPLKVTTSLQYSLFAIGGFLILAGLIQGYQTSKKGKLTVKLQIKNFNVKTKLNHCNCHVCT